MDQRERHGGMEADAGARVATYRKLLQEADTGKGTGHMLVGSDTWAEALTWALDKLEECHAAS